MGDEITDTIRELQAMLRVEAVDPLRTGEVRLSVVIPSELVWALGYVARHRLINPVGPEVEDATIAREEATRILSEEMIANMVRRVQGSAEMKEVQEYNLENYRKINPEHAGEIDKRLQGAMHPFDSPDAPEFLRALFGAFLRSARTAREFEQMLTAAVGAKEDPNNN